MFATFKKAIRTRLSDDWQFCNSLIENAAIIFVISRLYDIMHWIFTYNTMVSPALIQNIKNQKLAQI